MKQNKLFLILAMTIFGTIGIFRKNISLSSASIACFRGTIGALFIILFKLLTKRKIEFSSIKKHFLLLVISGVAMGINWILLFEAYNYTSVATATAIYYLAPIFMSIGAALFFQESLTKRNIVCILTSFIGMVLVSNITELSGLKGILFALMSAILYASVVLMNRKIDGIDSFDKTFVQLFFAGAVLIPYVLLLPNDNTYSFQTIILLAIVCFIHTGIAYVLYFAAVKDLKTSTVSVYSYIDPILAILLSALLLKEPLSFISIIGSAMILLSTFISNLTKNMVWWPL